MSTLVFEATAVRCQCDLHTDGFGTNGGEFHGYHPAVVMAGQPIWEDRGGGFYDQEDAEEIAEERLRSRLGLLLSDTFAVKGLDA